MQSVYEHAPPRAAHNHATTYAEKHGTTHAASPRTREPPTTAHPRAQTRRRACTKTRNHARHKSPHTRHQQPHTHATAHASRRKKARMSRENANESISVIAAPLEFALYKRTSGI